MLVRMLKDESSFKDSLPSKPPWPTLSRLLCNDVVLLAPTRSFNALGNISSAAKRWDDHDRTARVRFGGLWYHNVRCE